MKILLACICIGVALIKGTINTHAEETQIFLYQETDVVGTNVWLLPVSRAEQSPMWKDRRDAPPLSLTNAIQIADKWVIAKRGGAGDLEDIYIRAIDMESGWKYRNIYFYRIRFAVGTYGNHITCIVLMDGTVVEPQHKAE